MASAEARLELKFTSGRVEEFRKCGNFTALRYSKINWPPLLRRFILCRKINRVVNLRVHFTDKPRIISEFATLRYVKRFILVGKSSVRR